MSIDHARGDLKGQGTLIRSEANDWVRPLTLKCKIHSFILDILVATPKNPNFKCLGPKTDPDSDRIDVM